MSCGEALDRGTVARVFRAHRSVDRDPTDNHAVDDLETLFKIVRAADQPIRSTAPRRGAVFEYSSTFDFILQDTPGMDSQEVAAAKKAAQTMKAAEMWREAECLALSPHSMSRLKQLPELQQIIAHTALDAIHITAGCLQQLPVAYNALLELDLEGTAPALSPQLLRSVASTSAGKEYKQTLLDDETNLLQHLTPALRLCLAAEVAVGMLCPGQPPPPDTPEHAAALQMFVTEAFKHIEAELDDTVSSPDYPPYDTSHAVSSLWEDLQQPREQQQQERQQEPSDRRQECEQQQQQRQQQQHFMPEDIAQQMLAPLFDLQLQLPPQQLLQLLLQCGPAAHDLDQQQGHHHHRLQQQCQQQPQLQHSSAACATDAGILLVDICTLHPEHQRQLQQLLHDWSPGTAAASATAAVRGDEASKVASVVQECSSILTEVLAVIGQEQQQHCLGCIFKTQQQQQLDPLLQQSQGCDLNGLNVHEQEVQLPLQRHKQQARQDDAATAAAVATSASKGGSSNTRSTTKDVQDGSSCSDGTTDGQDGSIHTNLVADLPSGSSCSNTLVQMQCSSQMCTAIHKLAQNFESLVARLQSVAKQLIVKFIQDQWQSCDCAAAAPAWQQAVPLQVLLLNEQLQRAISALKLAICVIVLVIKQPGQHNQQEQQRSGYQLPATTSQALAESCKVAMGHITVLVQLIRQFSDTNASLNQAASPTAAAAGVATDIVAQDSSCRCHSSGSSSTGTDSGMMPSEFFSVAGPYACQAPGLILAIRPGPDSQPDYQAQPDRQASVSLRHHRHGPTDHQAGGLTACQDQPGRQAWALSKHIWQVLKGSFAWQHALQEIEQHTVVRLHQYASGDNPSDMDYVRRTLDSTVASLGYAARRTAGQCAQRLCELQGSDSASEYEVQQDVRRAAAVPAAVASLVEKFRYHMLRKLGFDRRIWDIRAKQRKARAELRDEDLFTILQRQGYGTMKGGVYTITRDELHDGLRRGLVGRVSEFDDVNEDSTSDDEQQQQQQLELRTPSAASRSINGSAAAAANGIDAQRNAAASVTEAAASTSSAAAGLPVANEVHSAHQSLRELSEHCCGVFMPLVKWHKRLGAQAVQAFHHAEQWWEGDVRKGIASQAVKDRRPKGWGAPSISSSSFESGSSSDANNSSMNSSSSSSSGGGGRWSTGPCNYHPACPLCHYEQEAERQQRRWQQQSSCSSSSGGGGGGVGGIYSRPAVPYDDPFMWRRLLWQLLGKLSPEAQAFYAHYLAVCPHCSDTVVWLFIRGSVCRSLWSSPTADAAEQQLATSVSMALRGEGVRSKRIRQYAAAINSAFLQTQNQSQSAVLVAQQLLLALSPIHCQAVPRPETAFMLPCSFGPAVGKALQQQLLSRPVLDIWQHQQAQLQTWHVWWHIGIRHYGVQKQQQQQQGSNAKQLLLLQRQGAVEKGVQQEEPAAAATICGLSDVLFGDKLSTRELDELYLDPDARVYAVGFAGRQLNGMLKLPQILSDSHDSATKPTDQSATSSAMQAARTYIGQFRREVLAAAAARSAARPRNLGHGLDQHQRVLTELEQQLSREDYKVLQPAVTAPAHEILNFHQQDKAWAASSTPYSSIDGSTKVLSYLCAADGLQQNSELQLYKQALEKDPLMLQQPSSDVERLVLQPPAPFDALLPQGAWVAWHRMMLDGKVPGDSNLICDFCSAAFDPIDPAAQSCPQCAGVQYCSTPCLLKDAAAHAMLCRHLASAKRRYGRCAQPKCTTLCCSHTKHPAFPVLYKLLDQPQLMESSTLWAGGLWAGPGSTLTQLKEQLPLLSMPFMVQEVGRALKDLAASD